MSGRMSFEQARSAREYRPRAWFVTGGIWLLCVVLSACSQTVALDEVPATTTNTASATAADELQVDELRAGEDWPKFLGLTNDGVSRETGLLDEWPKEGPPLVWEKSVGRGYSAPSIRGTRLVLHHRVDDEEVIECMSAVTGKTLWKQSYPSQFVDPYGYSNGPRCSPLLTETLCYTLGAEGKLICVQLASGEIVWQRDLLKDFQIPDSFFGIGATPILEGELLIVLVGGQPNSGVVAFDASNGETRWEAVGKATWDNAETGWDNDPTYTWTGEEMVVSYSSPIAATIHGKRHVLCLMRHGLVSLDPVTGRENFHHWFRARVHESVNAAVPVVVDDTILLSAAYRVGSELLKVHPDGQGYDLVWSDPRNLLTHWSTAIYLDGCYLGFSGRHENEGELRCLEAETGKVLWQATGWDRLNDLSRGPNGEIIDKTTQQAIPWPLYGRGSKIMADGKFIVLAERGMLALLTATTDGCQEISRCSAPRMNYPSWTAPVLSRGRLYLRCDEALVCLDLIDPDK